jgi:hypothetical protein
MKIFIIYNNETHEIEVEEKSSIEELKIIIEGRLKVKKEYQILSNQKNNFYYYEKSIQENNIIEEDILILINMEEKEDEVHFCCKNLKIIFIFKRYLRNNI